MILQRCKCGAMPPLSMAKTIHVENGRYIRWQAGAGVELWVQTDHYGVPFGLYPHFTEDSVFPVGLTRTIQRPDDTPLDGAFYGWAAPHDNEPGSGYFPFVFDVPNTAVYSDLTLPQTCNIQLAAFAHELSLYNNEATYRTSQTEEPKFATVSFIPSGTFTKDGAEPTAHAFFTGHIMDWALRTNPATHHDFYWIRVQTLGDIIDVVATPELITKEPIIDGIAQGSFWLTGKLLF